MNARWSIELFGGLRARQENQVITRFRTQKTAALLAFLAYHPRMHAREVVIDVLWSNCTLAQGRNNLRVALSSLRHQLEPPGVPAGSVIVADRASVGLNPEAATTDVARFDAALHAAARVGSSAERLQLLCDAVELYQGDLLSGFYENWLPTEQQRLEEEFFRALHQVITSFECAGDLNYAIHYAERGIRVDPLREEAHRDLMRLLAASGQPEMAQRHFSKLKLLLAERMDVRPSAATVALVQSIANAPGQRASIPSVEPSRPEPPPECSPPIGTVTFLAMDVEGVAVPQPAAVLETLPDAPREALHATFRRYHGEPVQKADRSWLVAFQQAGDAIACAIAGQRVLAAHPSAPPLRMALCTGDVELHKGEYQGRCLHLVAQILLAAHGGQILCAESTTAVLRQHVEAGVRLVDLGCYCLRGVAMPERLFEVVYPDMSAGEFPPPRVAPAHSNLPLVLTRFFGRESEQEQLRQILLDGDTRLLTLTGIGGSGKTRLALEVAQRIVKDFAEPYRGAVWFVPLADLTSPQLIVNAVRDALRLREPQGVPSPDGAPLEGVIQALSRQPSLLILDNFEQLAADGVDFVMTLLARVPTLTCLVTSSRRLDQAGEHEFPLRHLPTPQGPDTPEQLLRLASVQLFVNRAQAVRPDFQVTERNAPAVAALCKCLEGIPLAIELAAARAQVLTAAQILARLAERFDLLTRRSDRDTRHRSLRAAIDWSYHLLAPELQQFFARISVFRGGWSLEAAESVCRDNDAFHQIGDERAAASVLPAAPVQDHLQQLCNCSLVMVESGAHEIRFSMLNTLREFAAAQVAAWERPTLEQRHAEYYLALAENSEAALMSPQREECLGRLEADQDNFRAALQWSLKHSPQMALRLAGALWRYWEARSHFQEGRDWLDKSLSIDDCGSTLDDSQPHNRQAKGWRAKALNGAGRLAWYRADFAAARDLLEESLALARELGDKRLISHSLHSLGLVAMCRNDATARDLLAEGLAIGRELRDKSGIKDLLLGLSLVVLNEADFVTANGLLQESLAYSQELGDKRGLVFSLNNLGFVAYFQGDYSQARALHEKALVLMRELGEQWSIARALLGLGNVARAQGDAATAQASFSECLAIHRDLKSRWEVPYCLEAFAYLAVTQGQLERAATLLGTAEALRASVGHPLPAFARIDYERFVALLRAELDEGPLSAAWFEGGAMTREQAIPFALEE